MNESFRELLAALRQHGEQGRFGVHPAGGRTAWNPLVRINAMSMRRDAVRQDARGRLCARGSEFTAKPSAR
jgi:hypothetical protein